MPRLPTLPAITVTGHRPVRLEGGAQISGPGLSDQDDALAELRGRYPTWTFWRGHATGECWAMPPAGHPHRGLVNAGNAIALAANLAEITSWDKP